MPQLKNPKMEAVAQGLFAGKQQLQAYKDAGYTGNTGASASKVCQHVDVQIRLAELVRERHEAQRLANERTLEQESITRAWIVTRTKYVIDRSIRGTKQVFDEKGAHAGWAVRAGDDQAALKGLTLLAQMGGYLVQKVEIGQPGDHARLTDDELTKELLLVGESIGLDPKQIHKAITGE
jgi:hypothetical protein